MYEHPKKEDIHTTGNPLLDGIAGKGTGGSNKSPNTTNPGSLKCTRK